jgi:hypothetical protein
VDLGAGLGGTEKIATVEFDFRAVQPVASRCTDCAIPAAHVMSTFEHRNLLIHAKNSYVLLHS